MDYNNSHSDVYHNMKINLTRIIKIISNNSIDENE